MNYVFFNVFIGSHSKSLSAFQALVNTETLGGFQISSQFSSEGLVITKAESWQREGDLDVEDAWKRKKQKAKEKFELLVDIKEKFELLLRIELCGWCF